MLAIGFGLWFWLVRNDGIVEVGEYVTGDKKIDSTELVNSILGVKDSGLVVSTKESDTTSYESTPLPTTQISATNPNSSYSIYPQYLFFDFNKSNLTEENRLKLERLYRLIHKNAIYSLEADGYADQSGSDAYNLKLSKRRAETAVNYLINKGLPQGRINVVAHGKQQPSGITDNAYKSIMTKDEFERRVELILKVNGERVNLKEKIEELEKAQAPKPKPVEGESKESLITRYYHLYRILHQEHHESFNGDSLELKRQKFITTDSLAEGVEVFGWHPYWMKDAYKSYSYNLLSTIAFFSYDVNPKTGSYRTDEPINDWKTTALVDSAKATGSKILLTVTNHGYFNNKELLDNEKVQNVLIDSLLYLVNLRDGDGVDVDFEVIPKGYADKLTRFIQRLSASLKAKNPKAVVSVDLPAVDHFESFDIKALNDYVDFFVIMGYDYHGASGPPGPISPLSPDRSVPKGDENYNLPKSLQFYLGKGAERSKLIMGLPHYGALWTFTDAQRKSSDAQFDAYLAYRDVQAKYSNDYTANFDTASTSYYYDVVDDGQYKRCWFDNAKSLGKKYDWTKEERLRGIGIWALGYDNGYIELWREIGWKYTKGNIANQPWTFSDFLLRYRNLLIACIAFLLLFALLGFLWSLFDWRVREILFYSPTFQIFYTVLLVLLAALLMWLLGIINNRILIFVLGLLIGWVITSVIKKILFYRGRYIP